MVADLSEAISNGALCHRIRPIGILGLVANTIAETGFGVLASYGRLLTVLLGSMLFIALVQPNHCGL